MSEAGHSSKKGPSKHGLAWLYFLFGLVFVAGGMYAIFYHGFLGQNNQNAYRQGIGQGIVVPTIDIVPERTAKAISNGETSYKTCAACHGTNLEGLACPSLKDNEWLHFKEPKETELAKLINHGVGASEAIKAKSVMPPRGGLESSTQVWEVIYYLSTKNTNIIKDAPQAK
ncbi:MAG: cytochrome c [Spirochaetia bacterium]|nr:cytochrome c [Spirochaetia bacterium]